MSHLKKFSYPDISGRWMIYTYVFLLFFILTFFIADTIFLFKQFLPYYSFTTKLFIFALLSLFLGNITGRGLYSFFNQYKILNIVFSFIFVSAISFFYFKHFIFGAGFEHFELYLKNKYISFFIILLPVYFSGIINTFLLKLSCGDFVDEKNLLNHYHIAFFSSIAAAIFINHLLHLYNDHNLLYSIIICSSGLFLILFSILIKNPYQHKTMLAKHFIDEDIINEITPIQRDDLLFTYSNFSFIIIYILLGYVSFIKFFNNLYFYTLLFSGVMLTAIITGYIIGQIKRQSFWYVYSEMLYPIFFIISLYLLYYFDGKCSIKYGLIFVSIPGMIFGFSLSSTVYNIYTKYDHQRRFNILNFSLFILPFPIIFAASFLHFSYVVFFIVLYLIALINLIIPGIFLINLKISYSKKITFFFLTLMFLPAIVLFHLYFKIPINTKLFYTNTQNYDILRDTNYNYPYISEKGEIKLSGITSFFISESTIKNHKRAAASTLLFIKSDSKGLIIDANQHFFRNPVFSVFKNSVCLDVIPDDLTDWNILPESGRQLYIPVKYELFDYLSDHKDQYDFIIDYPNILDQNNHKFKFSKQYYSIITKHLNSIGKYALIIDMQYSNPAYIDYMIQNLSSAFKHHAVFLFSNIALIVASNNEDSLFLDEESLNRISSIMKNEDIFGLLFFSPVQPLNHFLFYDINNLKQYITPGPDYGIIKINQPTSRIISPDFENYYLKHEPDLSLIASSSKLGWQMNSDIRSMLERQKTILQTIKNTEYSESINLYVSETEFLFELKRYSSYNSDLKTYIDKILLFKEKYYFSEALRLEKEKKWDDAAILYKAILNINNNNFDANYHFGLLFITMQDLSNAFKYLDTALKLKKDHPLVLYQMGVLMFSSNKINEAITYFEKAKDVNLNIYQLYMYLGLSYEQVGNFPKAKENYEKAILLDPNDSKLKTLLAGIEYKINQNQTSPEEKMSNMIDDEQGESMSIPVNKKAVKERLLDDER